VYIVKMFLNKLQKFEDASNMRQAENNKIISNHLQHQLSATEKLAEVLGRFGEKIDNLKK